MIGTFTHFWSKNNMETFAILQENMKKALDIVTRVIETKPPLPVMSNVLIQGDRDGSVLRVSASDLQVSISAWVGAKVHAPLSTTMPAKFLKTVVGKMPKERINGTYDEVTATLSLVVGTKSGAIKGIPSTEYPPIKEASGTSFQIAPKELKRMIAETQFAAAREDNRPILTGTNLRVKREALTFATADGYRLSVATTPLEDVAEVVLEINVPTVAMNHVLALIDVKNHREDVTIVVDTNKMLITFTLGNGDIQVTSMLLEGRFPDFESIVPQPFDDDVFVTVDRAALLAAFKFVADAAKDDAHSTRLTTSSEEGTVTVYGRSYEHGAMQDTVSCVVQGPPLESYYDGRFLVELLTLLPDERVTLRTRGCDSPLAIEPADRSSFQHVIMPMSR
jgi:DNA polymerase-3 subunit beta